MPLILGTNSIKDTGYDVANSIRLGENGHYLVRDKTTATNVEDFTISVWVKRAKLGTKNAIMSSWGGDSNNTGSVYFTSGDKLTFEAQTSGSYSANGGVRKITTQVFRDVSAWSHFVFKKDDGVFKIFHNGVEITDFDTDTESSGTNVFSTSTGNISIGIENLASAGHYFQGYIAETILVDGQALDPTSFGEFDEDSPTIWKPKDVSGLTFGNNGFYLDFEDASNLGNDASGGTDFTELNLAAIDQSTDTCTNNFATFNSLSKNDAGTVTFSNGNLTTAHTGSDSRYASYSTIGASTGKWYAEIRIDASSQPDVIIGVGSNIENINRLGTYLGTGSDPTSIGYFSADGEKYINDVSSSYGNSYGNNDIIGVAMDLDNNKLYFSKNGTWQNSANPSTGTNGVSISSASSTTAGFYFFSFSDNWSGGSVTLSYNFGNGYFGTTAVSSAGTNASGIGIFEYDVPTGYTALSTKGLNL